MNQEKVWIYLSNQYLSDDLVKILANKLNGFVSSWLSHGKSLEARFEIRCNRYILIFVNQALYDASGCSIDKMVRFIQSLEQEQNIALIDRTLVGYFDASNRLEVVSFHELNNLFSMGLINNNTLFVNHLIESAEQLEHLWQIPFSQTEYFRFVQSQSVIKS